MRNLLIALSLLFFSGLRAQITAYTRIDSLKQALEKIPDTARRQKALALHEIATAYMHISNHTQAASYYAESLAIASELREDLLIALIYRNMGVLSFNQANYKKASEYHDKALEIYEKRKDSARKGDLLKLMADNMLTQGDSANAHRYYDQAIAIFKKNGHRLGEAMAYSNLSLVYKTRYVEKIRWALEARKILDSLQTDNPIPAINSGNLGMAYFDIVRYDHMHLAPAGPFIPATKKELLALADTYLRESINIAQSKQDVANASYFTGVLAELQEYNGNYKDAYYNIRKYFETNDSLYSQDIKNQVAALQSKQEIDLKNTEIDARKLQLKAQRTQLILLAAGAALLLIIGLLLYRQGLIRKRNNSALRTLNHELATANQVKAKLFAILSHDLRSPIARLVTFLQFRKMRPGMLEERQVKEHERKIEESAQSLLATMESMLLWSKEQMEHFEPVMSGVEIGSVFEYIKRNFSDLENINFSFSADESLIIHTDENYLKAILYNLTSNSIRAVKGQTAPRIDWRAWKEVSRICLSITDNGRGIPAEQAATFFQGVQNTDSKHGLGLLIIRDLAKAIDCRLSLGTVDSGTQVLLEFSTESSA